MISCARRLHSSGPGPVLRLTAFAAALLTLYGCAASAGTPVGTSTPPALASATHTPAAGPGCTIVEAAPTLASPSLLEIEDSSDPSFGPATAAVTMLFYCDMQAAECEVFNRVLDQLLDGHPNELRVIHRLYPVPESAVPFLDKSVLSAQAVIAAHNQDRFWEMRNLLHSKYADWVGLSKDDFKAWLLSEANGLKLDSILFASDLESAKTAADAEKAYRSAVALGISSIPTVFINGRLQERPALSYDGLDSTIGLIALGARQFRTCPPFEIDPARQYVATLHTEKGDIVVALDAATAPLAVNSFVFLANQGWYDGTSFHSVILGFVAQGGDPSGTGRGGPGYYFINEVTEGARFDQPGVVGMINVGPDTNGSQFFITYAPQPQFDGSYTVLGHVIDGMDVLESLTSRDPQASSSNPPGDKIISVTVEIR